MEIDVCVCDYELACAIYRTYLGSICPRYDFSWVCVVLGTSCPGYEVTWVRVVLVRVVLGMGWLGYELSRSWLGYQYDSLLRGELLSGSKCHSFVFNLRASKMNAIDRAENYSPWERWARYSSPNDGYKAFMWLDSICWCKKIIALELVISNKHWLMNCGITF